MHFSHEREEPIDRRQLLIRGAATLLATLHPTPARGQQFSSSGSAPDHGRHPPRLLELKLVTAAPLAEMAAFYRDLLGFTVLGSGKSEIRLAAGATNLTFTAGPRPPGAQHDPFYHFAFNIPENKLLAARTWQLERGRLIPPPPALRDPAMPDDVVHFSHWDAHSLFFWDPAGNLVEYIARHTLGNAQGGPFTAADILYASEIAFIVDDVAATARTLKPAFRLEQYHQASDVFLALGDELGLVLLMRRGRNLGFGEGKPAAVYPTSARLQAPPAAEIEIAGFPYTVSAG